MSTNEILSGVEPRYVDQSHLREYIISDEGQNKIVDFSEKIRLETGNKEGWKKTCDAADKENFDLDDNVLIKIVDKLRPYIDLMPPGHDPGHFRRDLIHGIIVSDSVRNAGTNYSQSDCSAGLLAGAFHDIGTSILPRYIDRELGVGHAEAGAWLFDELTKGLLGENLRKLTVYSILAHTNIQKEIKVNKPDGYIKKPYFDELFEENGKLIGLGYKIARMADRLDTNGSIFSIRHIMAHFDKKEESNSDFSGGQWFEINEESLKLVLTPKINNPIPKIPTTLEHVLNFKKSNFGNSVYSKDDYRFPAEFEQILIFEIDSFDQMVNLMNNASIEGQPVIELNSIRELFKNISGSSNELFNPMWNIFENYWEKLNESEKQKWSVGFEFCKELYKTQLSLYRSKINTSNYPNTLKEIIDKLEKQ